MSETVSEQPTVVENSGGQSEQAPSEQLHATGSEEVIDQLREFVWVGDGHTIAFVWKTEGQVRCQNAAIDDAAYLRCCSCQSLPVPCRPQMMERSCNVVVGQVNLPIRMIHPQPPNPSEKSFEC